MELKGNLTNTQYIPVDQVSLQVFTAVTPHIDKVIN